MFVGHARVSTHDHHADLQRNALTKAGCEKIFTDTISGSVKMCEGLERAVAALRAGDAIVVWKLHRLGRSLSNLAALINERQDKGIGSHSLQENIDTTSGVGKLVFHLFASLAEFERDLIRERTPAGIAPARALGRLGGRPKFLDAKKVVLVRVMHGDKQVALNNICTMLGIGRATLYRYPDAPTGRPADRTERRE
jgi:DNA invertase Pin-like site-specific DNA recombinase